MTTSKIPAGFRHFADYQQLAKALKVTAQKATQLIISGTIKPQWVHDGFMVEDEDLSALRSGTFGVKMMSVRMRCSRGGLFGL